MRIIRSEETHKFREVLDQLADISADLHLIGKVQIQLSLIVREYPGADRTPQVIEREAIRLDVVNRLRLRKNGNRIAQLLDQTRCHDLFTSAEVFAAPPVLSTKAAHL